jgi:alpha-amylase
MAVVLSNGGDGTIEQPNHTYMDITKYMQGLIVTNNDGWADFRCNGGSLSVWVPQ